MVLLHGFMGSSEDWRGVAAALAGEFYCVVPDLPGHGVSVGLPPESYSFGGAARTLISLLDCLGLERAALAGYSMGGRLALYLALRRPERCSGLLLESTSPGIENITEREARVEADEERAARLESGDFGEFVADWYRQPLFASLARREGLVEALIPARLRNDPAELARALRGLSAGRQPSLWAELPGLSVPALAVAGALDERYVAVARRMAALSPRLRAAVVPGAGHNVHLEAPGEYIRLLKEALRSLYNPRHD